MFLGHLCNTFVYPKEPSMEGYLFFLNVFEHFPWVYFNSKLGVLLRVQNLYWENQKSKIFFLWIINSIWLSRNWMNLIGCLWCSGATTKSQKRIYAFNVLQKTVSINVLWSFIYTNYKCKYITLIIEVLVVFYGLWVKVFTLFNEIYSLYFPIWLLCSLGCLYRATLRANFKGNWSSSLDSELNRVFLNFGSGSPRFLNMISINNSNSRHFFPSIYRLCLPLKLLKLRNLLLESMYLWVKHVGYPCKLYIIKLLHLLQLLKLSLQLVNFRLLFRSLLLSILECCFELISLHLKLSCLGVYVLYKFWFPILPVDCIIFESYIFGFQFFL